eukprot:RCo008530
MRKTIDKYSEARKRVWRRPMHWRGKKSEAEATEDPGSAHPRTFPQEVWSTSIPKGGLAPNTCALASRPVFLLLPHVHCLEALAADERELDVQEELLHAVLREGPPEVVRGLGIDLQGQRPSCGVGRNLRHGQQGPAPRGELLLLGLPVLKLEEHRSVLRELVDRGLQEHGAVEQHHAVLAAAGVWGVLALLQLRPPGVSHADREEGLEVRQGVLEADVGDRNLQHLITRADLRGAGQEVALRLLLETSVIVVVVVTLFLNVRLGDLQHGQVGGVHGKPGLRKQLPEVLLEGLHLFQADVVLDQGIFQEVHSRGEALLQFDHRIPLLPTEHVTFLL